MFEDSLTLDSKVIGSGGGRLVAAIFALKEALNKSPADVAKKVLGTLVLHHQPFRSYWTLKDAHTLGTLVKERLDNFCSPQGIPGLRSLASVDASNPYG